MKASPLGRLKTLDDKNQREKAASWESHHIGNHKIPWAEIAKNSLEGRKQKGLLFL